MKLKLIGLFVCLVGALFGISAAHPSFHPSSHPTPHITPRYAPRPVIRSAPIVVHTAPAIPHYSSTPHPVYIAPSSNNNLLLWYLILRPQPHPVSSAPVANTASPTTSAKTPEPQYDVDWKKIAFTVCGIGAIVALGVLIYRAAR